MLPGKELRRATRMRCSVLPRDPIPKQSAERTRRGTSCISELRHLAHKTYSCQYRLASATSDEDKQVIEAAHTSILMSSLTARMKVGQFKL